MLYRM
jgi:hypothetical protein